MIPPKIPNDEAARLAALHRLRLIDTAPEARFDRFVRMAQRIFGAPISLLSLVDRDRQWVKARRGEDLRELPREVSICAHTILEPEALVVADAASDPRFAGNPLVEDGPRIRFYAGVPLRLPEGGEAVGALCICDSKPRELSEEDRGLLEDLGSLVVADLVSRLAETTDATTGLLDRAGFDWAARSMITTCRREQRSAVLLHIALDLLEAIDESHGHTEGEHALREMSEILRATLRRGDLIARISDGHFCALCAGASLADIDALVTRLERRIEAANTLRGGRWPLTFRVAHSIVDPSGDADWLELLANAQMERPRLGNTPGGAPRRHP